MVLSGFIMGRVGASAVILVGGTLFPWADPKGEWAVGDLVQLELVPGTTWATQAGPVTRRDTGRLLLLTGPGSAILAVPRSAEIPSQVDLRLVEVPAEVAEGLDPTFDTPDTIPEPATGDADRPLEIPPALRDLFHPPQSGPIPQ